MLEIYEKIINHLNEHGHEVYEKILSQYSPEQEGITTKQLKEQYKEWSEYVSECDFAIAEASYPSSIQVGFEVASILNRGKPVILLHKINCNPFYINDLYNSRLIKSEYSSCNDLKQVIDWGIEEVESISKKRFTFYITPDIDEYLEKLSRSSQSSKSEIIRGMLQARMDNQKKK